VIYGSWCRGSIINHISQLNIISTPTEHNKMLCGRQRYLNQYNFTATAVYLRRLKQTAGCGGQ